MAGPDIDWQAKPSKCRLVSLLQEEGRWRIQRWRLVGISLWYLALAITTDPRRTEACATKLRGRKSLRLAFQFPNAHFYSRSVLQGAGEFFRLRSPVVKRINDFRFERLRTPRPQRRFGLGEDSWPEMRHRCFSRLSFRACIPYRPKNKRACRRNSRRSRFRFPYGDTACPGPTQTPGCTSERLQIHPHHRSLLGVADRLGDAAGRRAV